jgi:hypothetical protein
MGKSSISPKDYEEAKLLTQELCIKIERVWCPALDSDILFNRFGFKHLIQKRSGQRTKKEEALL